MQAARTAILEGVAALIDKYGSEKVVQHREAIADVIALTWGVRKELAQEYITTVLKGRQAKLILEGEGYVFEKAKELKPAD